MTSSREASALAGKALKLIADPATYTARAEAVDADGGHVFAGTTAARAWSALGAVNRVAVLDNVAVLPWQDLTIALRDRGVTHNSPHAAAVAALKELADAA